MRLDDIPEPKGPQPGALFTEGFFSWTERYEYIEARSERYLNNYRDNPEYDLTQTGTPVARQQKAVLDSFMRYAEGSMTAAGVADQVKMLRNAFRKKIE